MAKRIGILTSGGDAPGQNACLKALVYNAIDQGFQVVGIRKGWEGLLHYQPENSTTHADNVMILSKPRVRDIDRLGGSFLHSGRLDPAHVSVETLPPFLQSQKSGATVDVTDHIKHVIAQLQLDGLVVLGDRGALEYAARLSQEGVPIVGIPKTVHNNVNGSDYSLGFSTALARGVHFINEVRAMAGSREEIAVVEILGRTSGLPTVLISLLAGADRTLIPEVPFDPDKLAELLVNDKRGNPNNYAILTMSEASSIVMKKAAKYHEAILRSDRTREAAQVTDTTREIGARVVGSGPVVTEILENITGQRMLLQPLSYLLRTGEPDGQDLLGALNFAAMAIKSLAEGKTGQMVAYRRGANYVQVPLETATQSGDSLDIKEHYDAESYAPKSSLLWAARA